MGLRQRTSYYFQRDHLQISCVAYTQCRLESVGVNGSGAFQRDRHKDMVMAFPVMEVIKWALETGALTPSHSSIRWHSHNQFTIKTQVQCGQGSKIHSHLSIWLLSLIFSHEIQKGLAHMTDSNLCLETSSVWKGLTVCKSHSEQPTASLWMICIAKSQKGIPMVCQVLLKDFHPTLHRLYIPNVGTCHLHVVLFFIYFFTKRLK